VQIRRRFYGFRAKAYMSQLRHVSFGDSRPYLVVFEKDIVGPTVSVNYASELCVRIIHFHEFVFVIMNYFY